MKISSTLRGKKPEDKLDNKPKEIPQVVDTATRNETTKFLLETPNHPVQALDKRLYEKYI